MVSVVRLRTSVRRVSVMPAIFTWHLIGLIRWKKTSFASPLLEPLLSQCLIDHLTLASYPRWTIVQLSCRMEARRSGTCRICLTCIMCSVRNTYMLSIISEVLQISTFSLLQTICSISHILESETQLKCRGRSFGTRCRRASRPNVQCIHCLFFVTSHSQGRRMRCKPHPAYQGQQTNLHGHEEMGVRNF